MSRKPRPVSTDRDPRVLDALLEAVSPREPPPDRKAALRAAILARAREAAPEGTLTVRAEEGDWLLFTPRVKFKVLYRDYQQNVQTALWRLQPGGCLPSHSHCAAEECLVLEGEIRIGEYRVKAGDYHYAKPGCHHAPVIADRGALLLVRSDIYQLRAAGTN
jgi:quercetin dioxygenase-like cupin family protein